ncbi:conserved unknown protein [Ectocarpus siliculosus]|uniref:Uncharacterized protein n=1 Tax=Ectocarpus siliculosus TaxID=2880 RepID=D7FWN6_ECTSI|nr:conserved unknown protein [Ectocarpus siliculosus]|eukprot:CBJ32124.1 conserved unknown protein [Ectocarpus siliculosus]
MPLSHDLGSTAIGGPGNSHHRTARLRIVDEFGPTVGSFDTAADAAVLNRNSLSVFLHRNLGALPLGKYRPLHDPGGAVRPLLGLFSSLAHCGVSPEDYLRYVEALETELGTTAGGGEQQGGVTVDDDAGSGAQARRARQRAQLEAEGWRAHVAGERDKANVYEAFVDLKRREGVEDFSDQLLLARRILRESATAKAALSLRLSHVYVDDIQWYSPAMIDILASLVAPGARITATADPHLAAMSRVGIFRAEHTAIARFKKAFPGAQELHLEGNHHSSSAIQMAMKTLEPRDAPAAAKRKNSAKAAKADAPGVADFLEDTAGVERNTSAAAAAATDEKPALATTPGAASRDSRLTCLTFQTEGDEVKALGRRVREVIKAGVHPGDIGVAAVGGGGVADTLVAALSAAGVPVESPPRFSAVFDNETPRMLMSFLRCLVHPSESTPLLHLLMSCPAYALPGGELTAALEGHLSRYVPLRSFLRDIHSGEGGDSHPRGGGHGVSTSARNVAGKLLSDVDRFAETAKRTGVREIMLDFLRYSGRLERLEEPTTKEEEEEGRAVAEFFELTARAEQQAGGDNVALVEPILRLFRRHGTGYMKPSGPRDDEAATGGEFGGSSAGSSGVVRVFRLGEDWNAGENRSYHTVFIPFCSRARLPGNLRTPRLTVPGPFRGYPEPRDTGSLRAEADLARAYHENRGRAMLYAALGSAGQEVCLSVSARAIRGKTHLSPSPFLAEILGDDAPREWITAIETPKDQEDRLHLVEDEGAAAPGGSRDAAPKVVEGGYATVAGRLESASPSPAAAALRLSFSSISSFAACPYSYFLQHVLNVSPPPNPRMVYGQAMHEGVAALLRGVASGSRGAGPPPTLEAVVEDFNQHLRGCAFESVDQLRTLRAAGVAGLESFMSRLIEDRGCTTGAGSGHNSQPRQLLVERKFMVKIPEASVVLSGIFDRVDIEAAVGEGSSHPGLLSITDYKSNVGAKVPSRMVRDNLQLRIYALAAERLFGTPPTEIAIESIEDGRRGVAVPLAADAKVALEAISATATAVRAERFEATPSFQACTFCSFKHMCRHSVVASAAL